MSRKFHKLLFDFSPADVTFQTGFNYADEPTNQSVLDQPDPISHESDEEKETEEEREVREKFEKNLEKIRRHKEEKRKKVGCLSRFSQKYKFY